MEKMRRFLLILNLLTIGFSSTISAQEYLRQIIIKPDSIAVGTNQLLGQLRAKSVLQSNESVRNYRDSINNVLLPLTPKAGSWTTTAPALGMAAGRVAQKESDLLWYNFLLSADKSVPSSSLRVWQQFYRHEIYPQGNAALMYEMLGKYDSAIIIIDSFQLSHSGYTSLDIQKNILAYKKGTLPLNKIINLGADSFRIWVTDKLFKYPANVDSLRQALATAINHRITAFSVPDKIIGQLVLDFADLTAKDKNYQLSLPFYDVALVYDPELRSKVEERRMVIAELEKSVTSTFTWASIIFAIPLLAFVIIIIGWIKNRV